MDATVLRADLIRDEGFRAYAYQDSLGHWTIGHGRLIDKALGGGITEGEAEYLLDNDITRVCRELDRHMFGWRLWPHPAGNALANMAFNLGWSRLSQFHKMLDALRREDFATAAQEALDSLWASQVGRRAERVAAGFYEAARIVAREERE